jgi:hypothetical protein
MFLLKVFRRMPRFNPETGRSDASGASSVRVIRAEGPGFAGVTAGTTVDGISDYSRRLRRV